MLFGIPLDASTLPDTVDVIAGRIEKRQFTQHVVVNVAKLVHMQSDERLRSSVEECDIINVDGMGVVWAARAVGVSAGERVAGIDLFQSLVALAESRGFPVYLLGARKHVVEETVRRLMARHPRLSIAGCRDGYFRNDEEPGVVAAIRSSGARLLFVAMSSPLKENFIARWRSELGVDFVMGVGGSFDVLSGLVSRAPIWMQKSGLEWVYRVLQEPGRLWWRYLSTNLGLLRLIVREYFRRAIGRSGRSA